VELQEQQPAPAAYSSTQRPQTGLTVSPLSPQIRSQLDIPDDITGVVVTDLGTDDPLSLNGIQPGFVICEVNRKPVDSVSSFNSAYTASSGKVLLYIFVNGENFFVVVDKSI
jgi:serine protease Do